MQLPFKQWSKVLLKQCALVFVCLRNLVWGAASSKPKCHQIWWCTSCRFLPVAVRFLKKNQSPGSLQWLSLGQEQYSAPCVH